MPYLNVDLDYFTHPKVVRLIGLLGPQHLSVPIRLWCYVGKHHCEDGSLKGYSVQEIESILGWKGKKGVLIDALIKVGFLDLLHTDEDEIYHVHDWLEHAGHLAAFKKRSKQSNQKRWKNLEGADPLTRSERLQKARSKGTHTQQQWEMLKMFFNNTCVRCMDTTMPIEKDHILPLYLDGSDGIDNIQPSCAKCNASKTGDGQDYRITYLIKTGKCSSEEDAKCLLERLLAGVITPPMMTPPTQPSYPSLPNQLSHLNLLGASPTPPNRKCAARDKDEPCQSYAEAGSRYCSAHREFYRAVQERMKGKEADRVL